MCTQNLLVHMLVKITLFGCVDQDLLLADLGDTFYFFQSSLINLYCYNKPSPNIGWQGKVPHASAYSILCTLSSCLLVWLWVWLFISYSPAKVGLKPFLVSITGKLCMLQPNMDRVGKICLPHSSFFFWATVICFNWCGRKLSELGQRI